MINWFFSNDQKCKKDAKKYYIKIMHAPYSKSESKVKLSDQGRNVENEYRWFQSIKLLQPKDLFK